ncbi:MAG: ferrochelatase [Gammaproteobacteria bacterium]|nr:ferrochelatase [Gammaproteobacteria bacterium]
MNSNTAVLLVNLGTPTSTSTTDVRTFLREFLIDHRVIDLPGPLRMLLVYGLILPFRTNKTVYAYKTIWTEQGSPLLINSRNLQQKLTLHLNLNNNNSNDQQEHFDVWLAMRYGKPKLKNILNQIEQNNYTRIIILPLYPQYASASSGSALEKSLKYLSDFRYFPKICCINEFYLHSGYIKSLARSIRSHFVSNSNNHLLFSYHGVPEKQNSLSSPSYSEQCKATTKAVAQELNLLPQDYTTCFQSRLGKLPWVRPYTDEVIKQLASQEVTNLTVICPSFIVDCLETLEEIDIRLRQTWLELGGKSFTFIPCLNDDHYWIEQLVNYIKRNI